MDTIDSLQNQLSTYQEQLDKHKKGIKKIIPLLLGIILIFPIIPLPSRHHKGIHSMVENLKFNYLLCVGILGSIICFVMLRHTYKERKRLNKEIVFLQLKIDKLKEIK